MNKQILSETAAKKQWGKRLKIIRKHLDLSTTDFSIFLNISIGSLSNYENGLTWIRGDLINKIKYQLTETTASFLIGISVFPFISFKVLDKIKLKVKDKIKKIKTK